MTKDELLLLRAVQQANQSGQFFRAVRCDLVEGLCRRGYLIPNRDSSLYLSSDGRRMLVELAERNKTAEASKPKARSKPRNSHSKRPEP